jgi:[ribosomal protein S18]-alanine N-acetyltransferase
LYTIRRAILSDLPFIYEGELSYIREIEPEQEARWRDGMKYHLRQWVSDFPRMFVATNEKGEPAGYCYWEIHGEAAVLASVYVDPSLRRAGLGRQLMNRYMLDAKEQGLDQLSLGVRENNGARHMYEAAGFRFTHEDRGYRHYVLENV